MKAILLMVNIYIKSKKKKGLKIFLTDYSVSSLFSPFSFKKHFFKDLMLSLSLADKSLLFVLAKTSLSVYP